MGIPRKITPQSVAKAGELARLGLNIKQIAAGLGVAACTLSRWINDPADGLERGVRDAIQRGGDAGREALVRKLANGDERSATWLLSHSPRWRDDYSDAAHSRREVQRVLGQVVAVIEGAAITDEQRRDLLLRLAAAGIITAPDSDAE